MTEHAPTERAQQWYDLTQARVDELDKEWRDVVDEAGLSHPTLLNWRRGEPVARKTDRLFSRALGWAQGSRQRFLETGAKPEPVTVVESWSGPSTDPVRTRWQALESRLADKSPEQQKAAMDAMDAFLDAIEAQPPQSGHNGNGTHQ